MAAFTSGCPFQPSETVVINTNRLLATSVNTAERVCTAVKDPAAFKEAARYYLDGFDSSLFKTMIPSTLASGLLVPTW